MRFKFQRCDKLSAEPFWEWRTDDRIAKIFTLHDSHALVPLKNDPQSVEFVLPHLEEYEVVVIEK